MLVMGFYAKVIRSMSSTPLPFFPIPQFNTRFPTHLCKVLTNSTRNMGRKSVKVEFDESPPDDFDPSHPYKDPVAMLEMREHLVREKWIQIETAKILRDKLRWCYRVEGVNHLQKCRHLVHQYLEATRGVGWGKDHRPHSLHGPKVEAVEADE